MNKQNVPAVPDENQIEELLGKLQPVPGEYFHQKMKHAAWRMGEERVTGNFRVKIAFALVTITVLAALFASPTGRAWAQEVVHFFTRIQSSTVELPESMKSMEPPAPYNVPLVPLFVPEVSPEMKAIAGCEIPQKAQSYSCQIALAESQLGFDLKELPSKPEGWNLEFVRFNVTSQTAAIGYSFDARYRSVATLYLVQGLGDVPNWNSSNPWDVVPADRVETVKIGDHAGEYVEGLFSIPAGSSNMVWDDSRDRKRLAWHDGTRWYLVELWPNPNAADKIKRDEMIALAESLVDSPHEKTITLDPNFLHSISDAEQASGLDLKAPALLPMDTNFSYARFHEGQVQLVYGINEELVIHEWKGETLDFDALSKSSYSNYRIVNVNGRKAFYGSVEGADPHLFLWWQEDGLNYQMFYYQFFGLLDRNRMIAIAESMQDVDDFRTKASRPYEHVAIYEKALLMNIKEFPEPPDGWSFANLWGDPSIPCITLVYTSVSEPGWLYITQCSTDERYRVSDIPLSRIKRVRIGDNKGQYAVGEFVPDENGNLIWNPDLPSKQLYWQADGLWLEMALGGESAARYDQDALISLAESLR